MTGKRLTIGALMVLMAIGCKHPSITAVSLSNPDEPDGIPFYLPKPLLIVSKNFRNIESMNVGLTSTPQFRTNLMISRSTATSMRAQISWD